MHRYYHMTVVWLKSSKARCYPSIYNSSLLRNSRQQSQGDQRSKRHSEVVCQTATSKAVKHHSGNFAIQLFLFLHVVHCSVFAQWPSSSFTILDSSVLQHNPASSIPAQFEDVFITGYISISKSPSYSLPIFSWHKRLQQSSIHPDDYKHVAL